MSMNGRYVRLEEDSLLEILEDPSSLLDVLYPGSELPDESGCDLDIDKTWHIIHFLLHDEPLSRGESGVDCVLGGVELSSEDVVYGPARYLTAAEVREVADSLDQISFDRLWARYDPTEAERAELYWSDSLGAEEYVRENYVALREFFSVAGVRGQAVIMWLA